MKDLEPSGVSYICIMQVVIIKIVDFVQAISRTN